MNLKLLSLLSITALFPACGAMRAAASPKTMWAISEPAPLTVVVHRAEAAQTTAQEVERLLTSTATDAESSWLAQTQLAPALIEESKRMYAEHPHYRQTKLRVLPAAIWADSLAKIESDTGANPSLLSAIAPALAQSYADIGKRIEEIAAIEAQIKQAELLADDKKLSATDRKAKELEVEALEKKRDQAEARVKPARDAFIAVCKRHAASVPATQRDLYGVAAVNLRQAVDDGEVANGAAVARYALAVPGFTDSLKLQAKASASDYIFERTAKRLNMSGFSFELKFDNQQVSLSINGMAPEDLGELSLSELIAETVVRTQRFAVASLKLLASTSYAQEKLAFEAAVLDAILAGFESSGHKPALAALAEPKRGFAGMLASFSGSAKADTKGAKARAQAEVRASAQRAPASSGGEQPQNADLQAIQQALQSARAQAPSAAVSATPPETASATPAAAIQAQATIAP